MLEMGAVGRYAHVDLDLTDGRFAPEPRGWTSGPDSFELEIGNLLVYGEPLWEGADYLQLLKRQWLPYYAETLRRERLAAVRRYCLNNLDHIPLFVQRGLYFQAFHRLCNAFQEFLQALFIARRTYPIAYDKWIREQVVEILGEPEVYRELTRLLAVPSVESRAVARRARRLGQLLEIHAPDPG